MSAAGDVGALRLMTGADLPRVMAIVAQAQAFLAAKGIPQWQDGYPDETIICEDIRLGEGYVLERDGGIQGIVSVTFGDEPSYAVIHEGAWTTTAPYACIHRMAVDASARGAGVADALMDGAEALVLARGVRSIRVDTHRLNTTMQRLLTRHGYALCGVIYLVGDSEHGAERVALEKELPA